MKCSHCGVELPAGAGFCHQCGAAAVAPTYPLQQTEGQLVAARSKNWLLPRASFEVRGGLRWESGGLRGNRQQATGNRSAC